MLDLRWIRDNPDQFDRGMARRGLPAGSSEILALDGRRRQAQTRLQELQSLRNERSRQIGGAKAKGEDASALMTEVSALKDEMQAMEAAEQAAAAPLDKLLEGLPNRLADDVPDGADEKSNVE